MIITDRNLIFFVFFKIEKCIEISKVTVSHVRKRLLQPLDEGAQTQEKYQIISDCSNNTFHLARKMTISSAIRSLKFRLLHRDIFPKSRLHKIKLVDYNN